MGAEQAVTVPATADTHHLSAPTPPGLAEPPTLTSLLSGVPLSTGPFAGLMNAVAAANSAVDRGPMQTFAHQEVPGQHEVSGLSQGMQSMNVQVDGDSP